MRIQKMPCAAALVLALILMPLAAHAQYQWLDYGGHRYALTQSHSTWAAAELEAVAAGGHLVTIGDDAENTFLTEMFADAYSADHVGEPLFNIVWIGLHFVEGEWRWVSQEPLTYFRDDYVFEGNAWPQGGTDAYLHLANHPVPGTWNANPLHESDPGAFPLGVIEVVPEPASTGLYALVAGTLLLRRKTLRRVSAAASTGSMTTR